MGIIASLVCCVLFGYAGWYLYRNPRKVLDACTKGLELNFGTSILQFFSFFGGLMMLVAIVSLIMTVVATILHILSTPSS
jgi:hypothetical protein